MMFFICFFTIPEKDSSFTFKDIAKVIKFVDLNLKSNPIKSFTIQDSLVTNSTCPKNSVRFPLGLWPGTISGCNCKSLTK